MTLGYVMVGFKGEAMKNEYYITKQPQALKAAFGLPLRVVHKLR